MPNPVIEFLQRRRSVVSKKILASAPTAQHLDSILGCGLRVPDHSNVQPWRVVVIEGENRRRFGEDVIVPAARIRAEQQQLSFDAPLQALEASRLERAGVVIAVLCTPVIPHKIPPWEQHLSSAAVCMQMLNAAQSLDYAAQWITEWPAYDPAVISALGGNPEIDKIAGFIYIGSKQEQPAERARPEPAAIISRWQP